MHFSVLLSVYKKEQTAYLKQSLDSIFAQTIFPDEVILVEDGPLSDELYHIIDEYQSRYTVLKILALQENEGLGQALNEGLKHCSYDLVARMDTDDIAKPNRFEKQIKVFKDHPELDVVGAWIDEFNEELSNIISLRKLPENPLEIYEFAKKRCPLNHPVVMFRKEVVLNAGGYKHFPLLEDYYLWVRMLMNGAKMYNIQESLLYFRASHDMYKRRGGWKYAINELHFQVMLFHIGFISQKRFIINVCVRFLSRIIPNVFRAFLYKKFLR